MVNKAALGVIGVIVIATVGGGLVLGTMLDDGGEEDDGGAEDPTDDPTETPVEEPTATATPSEEDDSRDSIPARRFESDPVAENVTRYINEARNNETVEAQDGENVTLESLSIEGNTADALQRMAREHSIAMADAGHTGHAVGDTNVSQRYRAANLASTCRYDDGLNIVVPDEEFEVVNVGAIGNYDYGGSEEPFVENESMAARLIVDDMLEDWRDRQRLHNPYYEYMGVGAEITEENLVYVTINFCS